LKNKAKKTARVNEGNELAEAVAVKDGKIVGG
jgi:predicted amidohydrolase YtcJ